MSKQWIAAIICFSLTFLIILYKNRNSKNTDIIKYIIAISFLKRIKHSVYRYGNRAVFKLKNSNSNDEVILIYKNETCKNTYSREEIYDMLITVRYAEKSMGWKCPEPKI
jgi:hypothetical protein